jgi:hypothetical protein
VIGGARRKLLGGSVPGTPNKRQKLTPLTPSERNKKMDPRTKAAPAVEAVSKQLSELQQVSRAARAQKRMIETKKSRSGRLLRERHSIHTFPVRPATTPKQKTPQKRRGLSVASTAGIRSVVGSIKKTSTAIASRTSAQRKGLLGLPNTKQRAVSASSSTSRLLSKKSTGKLRQSRLSLNESSLTIETTPDTPTSALRHSGRAHKPSPKMLENAMTVKPRQVRTVSSAPTASSTNSRPSRPTSRKAKASQKDFWDLSGSDDDRDDSIETPDDSPRRLSKRSLKPSPKVMENSRLASSTSELAKRTKSRLSFSASLRNVAKSASSTGSNSVKKVQAFMTAGRNGEKNITKTMRKISGAP